MRQIGWFGTIVGALVLACGLAGAFIPLVAIGLALACAGIWNVRRPSVTGLIVDGVAMILTGAFNCLAWLWIDSARPSGVAQWIFGGLVQIVWGIRRLAAYSTARFATNDPQAIVRLESIVRDLAKRKAKADPVVAEFWTGGLRKRRNRLGLFADGAVGLLEHQAVRLERRADIWIESRGTSWLGRSVKVKIQMSDLHLTGEMSAAHFERFEHWKLGMSQSSPIAA